MKQNALQEESKDLEAVETQIVHHPVHGRSSFFDSWEFMMLLTLMSIAFGFALGLALKYVL